MTGNRRHPWLVLAGAALLTVCTAIPGSAQTLAHPNWVGNGMSTDPWWQHAVIYRVDGEAYPTTSVANHLPEVQNQTRSGIAHVPGEPGVMTETVTVSGKGITAAPTIDYKYLMARINALRSLGIDALLLPTPPMPAQSSASAQPATSADDDVELLDQLIRAASLRGVRVLLTLEPSPDQDLNGIARFWLNRGIAGFYVTNPPGSTAEENQATVQLLRHITASVVGQRIVLSSMDTADSAPAAMLVSGSRRGSHVVHAPESSPGMQVDTQFAQLPIVSAASLRTILSDTAGRSNMLLELPAPQAGSHSLAEVLAAAALTTHPAALISSDVHLELPLTPDAPTPVEPEAAAQPTPAPQPGVFLPFKPYVAPVKKPAAPSAAPTDPLTVWYQQLATLHHSNAAVRAGEPTFLDFDQQNAVVWVERPASVSSLTPAVVIACNLSSSPVTLSVRASLESLGLRGNYLRTLLRSDKAMGPQDLATVVVPAYGVYIGELRR